MTGTGQKDINDIEIKDSDLVHCWDGDIAQIYVTASQRGMVNLRDNKWCVAGNELALGCAEYVEVISNGDNQQ